MHERGIGGRTPPAVPTIPLDALIARADSIAKRWLVELLDAAPLAAAGDVPVADLAADGPAVCAATVEALASERGLRAAVDQAPDVARLAGATTPTHAIASAEALRRAVFAALQEQVPAEEGATLAAVAHRLGHVTTTLAQAAITRSAAASGPLGEPAPAGGPAGAADPPADSSAATGRAAHPFAEPAVPFGPHEDDDSVVPLPRPATGEPDFGPLWMAALERQIGAGGRFALLLMELDGAERLRVAEDPEALAAALERVGRGVGRGHRRGGVRAPQNDGRLWVIAPGAGRAGASALARRIAAAVERAAELRGAPLTASLGAALFPDDSRDPAGLAGEAEEGLLAARAAGVRFTGDPEDPDEPAIGPRLVR
jgi:GGDEF domain-containing protein